MRDEAAADRALELYGDTVRRICFIHLKNGADVEDIFQEVFLKYLLHNDPFESDAHEKAWLIRVTVNACKDLLKSFFCKRVVSLDDMDYDPPDLQQEERQLIESVLGLPSNQRNAIYLFYYEGYSAVEIAGILGKNENTVYSWLARGRRQLAKTLGSDGYE